MGKGRPNKYISHVKPYLSDITEMALTMTEKQIAQALGVAYSSFKEYKKLYSDLADALKNGRNELVKDLRSTLIHKAQGYNWTETKRIKRRDPDTGKMELVEIQETVKHFAPDVAALNLLLKNYDKENWANDPQMLRLREKELELKKEQIDNASW